MHFQKGRSREVRPVGKYLGWAGLALTYALILPTLYLIYTATHL